MKALLAAAVLLLWAAAAAAQDTGILRVESEATAPGALFDGLPIDAVEVDAADPAVAQAARAAFTVNPGDPVDWAQLRRALGAVRALPGAAAARFTLERSASPTTIRLLLAIPAGAADNAAPAATAFPDLLKDDRSQLTVILTAALGVYSDSNPWFGDPAAFTRFSPVATHPPDGHRASWGELMVEAGLGGITQIGQRPLWAYAAGSALLSAAAGQDLFTNDTRAIIRPEKAYAGLIWGDKARGRALNFSFGRQNFNLGDGFLLSQYSGSSNAGPRPGLFLNPRVAFDMAVLADLRLPKLRLRGFFLDPDELEDFESNTQFAGISLSLTPTPGLRAGFSYVGIPRSDSRLRLPDGGTVPRAGLDTLALDLRADDPLGMKGLWVQGEFARQSNGDYARAHAGYATIGYKHEAHAWKPAISWRTALFSGDDPATERLERYDPLLSGGLAEWVQGVNFKKIVSNSNMRVHRLRATARPSDALGLTLDFFDFEARETTNLGGNPALGTLASTDIGQEITLRGDWFLSRRLYLLLVGSVAVPGDGIEAVVPAGARTWTTLQASAFLLF